MKHTLLKQSHQIKRRHTSPVSMLLPLPPAARFDQYSEECLLPTRSKRDLTNSGKCQMQYPIAPAVGHMHQVHGLTVTRSQHVQGTWICAACTPSISFSKSIRNRTSAPLIALLTALPTPTLIKRVGCRVYDVITPELRTWVYFGGISISHPSADFGVAQEVA